LREDLGRIGSASGTALGTPEQVIDSGKGTVWHGARMSDSPMAKQATGSLNRADVPKPSRFQSNLRQNKRVQRHLDTVAQPHSNTGDRSLFFRCRKFLNLQT
jgi:hypothetical protein